MNEKYKMTFKIFIFLTVLLNTNNSYCQKDIDLYNQGNVAFSEKRYLIADSLFTASLYISPSSEAFFNRAATKIILKDTCNACKDLAILKVYYADKEAIKLYYEYCVKKFDTIYFDKNLIPNNITTKRKYYEVKQYPKYDTIIIGEFHKIKHDNTIVLSFGGVNDVKTDIYATYFIKQNVKYYNFIYSSTFEEDNKNSFEQFETNFTNYLCNKYDFSKLEYKDKWFVLDLYINENGTVIDCDIMKNPFGVFDIELQNKIKTDIKKTIKLIPKLIPEKLINENVSRLYNITVGLEIRKE